MTAEHKTASSGPGPDEVRGQLEHMLASDIFLPSPQLAAFLRFVVEAALRGQASRIKAYTIAVEVLRRDTSFDPQIDPIVRVEATRLRRTIERYYTGPGTDDEILIELSRGSYVPRFRFAMTGRRAGDKLRATGVTRTSDSLRAGNGMPNLFVREFETRAAGSNTADRTSLLRQKLRNAFSRFDTVNTLFNPAEHISSPDSSAAGADRIVDYQLSGTIDFHDDRKANVRLELLDNMEAKVVWSGEYDLAAAAPGQIAGEDQIVLEVAAKLLQPFGVIRSHERVKHLAGSAADPRCRCIVESSESLRSFDPDAHESARACLERLTAVHKDFGLGFSYLAALYFREHLYGFGARDDDPPALDRALRAARQGIELAPESARAYQQLFAVLFGRGEMTAAFAAGEMAMELNPFDMTILSDYGGRLILTGEVALGMDLLRRATQVGEIRPSWYHFYVFLANHLNGRTADASMEANQITAENYPLGFVARAIAANACGDRNLARSQIDRLVKLMPEWRTDVRGQLAKFVPDKAIAARLERDLAAAGISDCA